MAGTTCGGWWPRNALPFEPSRSVGMTLRSLLVATDFSDDAGHAAHRAAVLAAEKGGQLELLHVISRPSLDALRDMFRSHPGAEATLMDDVRVTLSKMAEDITRETG